MGLLPTPGEVRRAWTPGFHVSGGAVLSPRVLLGFWCVAALFAVASQADAQQLSVGRREFAVTRTVEDPLVADELLLPSVLHIKRPADRLDAPTRETDISGEFLKTLTPNLGLALAGSLVHLDPDGESARTEFDNLEVRLKYALFASAAHEAILSAGLGWDVGGTGSRRVGADSFDVVKPAIFWGKGFGDLPEGLGLLKPLAATGIVGAAIPTRTTTRTTRVEGGQAVVGVERNPNALEWGLVLEYNLAYLQSFVADVGLRRPFKEIIPVVEVGLETFLDRGAGGKTNGSVNPGVVWQGDTVQVLVEAVVPVNDRTGKNVGVQATLTFFLAELFPRSLGRPLFGR